MKKSIAVLGLGKFGESIARELIEAGCEVLVVDMNKERVQNISDIATYAVTADVCDAETMKTLGISNMDAVVVAITHNLNASILATILAKESGVPYVIAKSCDDTHTKILEKVGADKIIIPEHESGIRIARHLVSSNVLDFFELSQRIRLVEINIKPQWLGVSLRKLNLRQKHQINVIAIRQGEDIILNPNPDQPLEKNMTLLIIADKRDLKKLVS